MMINCFCKHVLYIPLAVFFATIIFVLVVAVDQLKVLHNESWIFSIFLLGLVAVVPVVLFLAVLDGNAEAGGDEDHDEDTEDNSND